MLRRLIALAVIAAALVGLVAVTNLITRRHDAARDAARATVASRTGDSLPDIDLGGAADALSETAPFEDPVPLGDTSALMGDTGFEARLQASADGVTSYVVRVQNIGGRPFADPLKQGVWLELDNHVLAPPVEVKTLPPGTTSSDTLKPGSDVERLLVFRPPPGSQPRMLRISLQLGTHFPTAQWTVT